jgi:5-methylcytosine-specific restriction endonuclease McrA
LNYQFADEILFSNQLQVRSFGDGCLCHRGMMQNHRLNVQAVIGITERENSVWNYALMSEHEDNVWNYVMSEREDNVWVYAITSEREDSVWNHVISLSEHEDNVWNHAISLSEREDNVTKMMQLFAQENFVTCNHKESSLIQGHCCM